jgi:DNA uptake protein ComE-like DNA-binding protein
LPSTNDAETDAAQVAQFAIELAWGKTLMQGAGLSQTQIEAWLAAIAAIPEAALNSSQTHALDTLPANVTTELQTRLEARFIWLPERIKININTAELTVLAAHPNLGESTAQHIITTRGRAPLRDVNNIPNALGISPELAVQFGVNTRYFIATGRLTMGRVDLMARSLIQRQEGAAPVLLWTQPL